MLCFKVLKLCKKKYLQKFLIVFEIMSVALILRLTDVLGANIWLWWSLVPFPMIVACPLM